MTTETVSIDILGLNEPASQPAPPAQPRDESGKFAPKDKPVAPDAPSAREVFDRLVPERLDRAAAPDEPAPSKDSTPSAADAEATPEDPKRTAAREKAAKALELDGWKPEDLKGLSDERLVALGKAAKERHSEVSRKLEAQALERKASATAEVEPERRPAEPIRQPALDFKALVKPIAESLAMDEPSTSALAETFNKAVQAAVTQAREEFAREQEIRSEVDVARKELGERFPKLADDDEFREIVADAEALAAGLKARGRANTLKDAFEQVCRLRYFGEAQASQPEPKDTSKSDALQRKRDAGQPVSTTRTQTPRALTKEQRDRRYFDAILDGEDPEAARRRIYSG